MNEINKKILEIWKENFKNESGKHPCPIFYKKFTPEDKDKILFIGMNPSFKDEYVRGAITNSKVKVGFEDIYNWSAHDDEYINQINLLDSWAYQKNDNEKTQHSYFNKFEQLLPFENNDKKLAWNHIDLFFYRKTSQKDFKQMILEKGGKLNSFGEAQFKLSTRLIKELQPCLIVVVNAFASELIKEQINLGDSADWGITFDEDKGYDLLSWNECSKDVPIFFSSMLTGQRALDNHSFKRLQWHVKQALKDKNII
ncbi:hypothetical protein GFH30_09970 [Acinetobacter wanghuae]|uniref:Uracil-DNA glycosylase-like domain-containing protein n=1 Tax=Acinetobacter wanghuae TaxID=2662362 RepID=A0A5Q0P4J5_9GAMM|nr:hypothetical protein [Acinetobacter wanghuae]MQW91413.1 hypothetical protein [Acinetobacter wanghuae]QGA11684.1 hypothetical protein GFH30_09970 [Acinetobacter wanghuae]